MVKIRIQDNTTEMLPDVCVGKASAADGVLVGVPGQYENVQIAFGQSNGATLICPCTARNGGEWSFYASGAYFLAACETNYHITAKTLSGDSVYLGSGKLEVRDTPMNIGTVNIPVLPQDCYVRGANGLYYKVMAALDDDGVPYMIVDRNGVAK